MRLLIILFAIATAALAAPIDEPIPQEPLPLPQEMEQVPIPLTGVKDSPPLKEPLQDPLPKEEQVPLELMGAKDLPPLKEPIQDLPQAAVPLNLEAFLLFSGFADPEPEEKKA